MSTGIDRENGLVILMDISGENYFHEDKLRGLMMEIHPYGTPHHLVDHRRSIYLQPGAYTNIALEEVTTKMLPNPFKPHCEEPERKIVVNLPYSKSTCELECFLQKALDKCGCVPGQFLEFTRTKMMRRCEIYEMKCVFNYSSQGHCHECHGKCEVVSYKLTTSRLSIGNKRVYQRIRQTSGWENKTLAEIISYINENIIGFRIGFKNLDKHVRRYKEAVPWYERVSMLGGIMGLLLGFSAITGFELLFFVFDYMYITIKYRCTKEYLSAILQQEHLTTAGARRSTRRGKQI